MKGLTFFILFLSAAFQSPSAAQCRQTVLIIDTLDGVSPDFSIIRFRIAPFLWGDTNSASFPEQRDEFLKCQHIGRGIMTLIDHRADSSEIRISIDDAYGYLALRSWQLEGCDTIRIDRITTFSNCIPDTVRTAFTWLLNQNKRECTQIDLVSERKTIDSVFQRACSQSAPAHLVIRLNGRLFHLPLIPAVKTIIADQIYHGFRKPWYLSRRHAWKAYYRRKEAGLPFRYFVSRTQKVRTGYLATVSISDANSLPKK